MADVVALLGPPSGAWVEQLRRCWERGAVVLPVDHRLPRAAVAALLDALRPTMVEEDRRPGGHPGEDGDAIILATSGTTGAPKGVVLTHAAIATSARATSARLRVDPVADTWLCCLPVAHAGGLGVVTRALLTGTPLEVHPRFDADAVEAAGRRRGRVLVSLVATALRRVDPALFKTIVLGGDAPPPSLPPNAVVTYGMTETGGGCVYDGVPLDGVEVKVDRGEIWIRGPLLGRAYRRDGTDTALTDPDGWLHTGDGGRQDHDRLRVDGRLDDLIVTGGEKVWPAPVESAITALPGVDAVAVVGRPDPEWGQRVAAIIVPTDPADAPTVESVRGGLDGIVPRWAIPKEVEIVAELPRTALGKVRRQALSPTPPQPGHTPRW